MPAGTPDPLAARVDRTLIVACGALVRELRAVLGSLGGEGDAPIDVEYLPAPLHNRPERIAPQVDALLTARSHLYGHIVVAYADCGTRGALDEVITRHGATRLPGAHCYELFAGTELFTRLQAAECGTFYLTDFLARHFEALVWSGLGLDRHPELLPLYFGNYTRVVFLSQSNDHGVAAAAREAAAKLGLAFVHEHVGFEPFATILRTSLSADRSPHPSTATSDVVNDRVSNGTPR